MEKQFLLSVRNIKGFPKFQLFAVGNNYDTLSDQNFGSLGGGPSPFSVALTEPNNTPFTLTCSE